MKKTMRIRDSYHFYAVVTIIFWALAYVYTRLALRYFSALPLGFLRYSIASVILACAAFYLKMKLPEKKDWKFFIASGATGFFIYMVGFNIGCKTVSAATSSVIVSTAPVITALLAHFLMNEHLSRVKWAAIAVEFAGVTLLALMSGAFTVNFGILWLFLAALSFGFFNLLQRKLTETYSSLQTTAFSIFIGTAMLMIFAPTAVREVSAAPVAQWFNIAVLALLSSAAAYFTWAKAFEKAGNAASVSNYMFLTPFLTAILALLIAGESLDSATICGGAVILFGLALFNFGDRVLAKRR
ncbi:DMT family transporter [Synergistaceae bacterium OttesenSCG-928-D05]|nr:DMT family transporter [Synergistaceae bacterium OttesenSCG-928-D05]